MAISVSCNDDNSRKPQQIPPHLMIKIKILETFMMIAAAGTIKNRAHSRGKAAFSIIVHHKAEVST